MPAAGDEEAAVRYTDAADVLLHRLSLAQPPERIDQIKAMAEQIARNQGRRVVGKSHIVAAVCAAGPEFVEGME
jgi:hypothetical protein